MMRIFKIALAVYVGLLACATSAQQASTVPNVAVTFAADVLLEASETKQLSAGNAVKLSQLVAATQRIRVQLVTIVGHADKGEVNPKAISLERAELVRRELTALGIPSLLIYTEGASDTRPLAAAGDAKNRRVEIEIAGTRAANPVKTNP